MREPRCFDAAIWKEAARAHARPPELQALAFGGGPSGNTTSTQTTQPYSGQVPYLVGGAGRGGAPVPGIFPSAANLYSNYTPNYFPTSTVAPQNPTQLAGQQAEVNLGINGTPAVDQAQGFFGNLESGDFLSAGNPYFQNMANTVKASVLPGLESQLTQGNNDNPGVAYGVTSGLTSALGGLAYQNYQDTMGKMVQGGLIAPGLQNGIFQDVGAIQDAGNQQQQQQQAQLSDLVNRYNYYQQLPYEQLNMFGNQVSGNIGSTSTLSQPYFSNQLANILGAGFGGASILNSLASSGMQNGSFSFGNIPLVQAVGSIFQ